MSSQQCSLTAGYLLVKVISKAGKSEVFDLLFSPLSVTAAYFFKMNFCFSVFKKKLIAATHEQS